MYMHTCVHTCVTMLKVCSISEKTNLITLNIDANRYVADEPMVIRHDRPKTYDIGSNMGRPCWFTRSPSNYATIYDWNTYTPIIEPINTSPLQSYGTDFEPYMCAGVANDVAMVCRSCMGGSKIFTPFSQLYFEDRRITGFTIEQTGQRVFICNNNNVDINECVPLGESMPFGWWAPSYELSVLFAACGQLLARVSQYNCGVSLWDTRVGEITDIPDKHKGVTAIRRCTFRGEYMLFVCSFHGIYPDEQISTILYDLRNPGTFYDLVSADYNYPYITAISAF